MLDKGENLLHISKYLQVMPQDAGPYRCRVDFLRAPTRNVKIKLSLVGKTILILDYILYHLDTRVLRLCFVFRTSIYACDLRWGRYRHPAFLSSYEARIKSQTQM